MDKHNLICRLCMAALLYVGLGTQAAQAAIYLTAEHRLIASERYGGGTSSITFELILSNQGDLGVTGITLRPLDPHLRTLSRDAGAVVVESLPVGGTVSVVWTVSSPVSLGALLAQRPLAFEATGYDDAGNPVSFGLVSKGIRTGVRRAIGRGESTERQPDAQRGLPQGEAAAIEHDLWKATSITVRVSVNSAGGQAGGNSLGPSISATGRYVAFNSDANDLVADDTNEFADVFVHDRKKGTTERVSVDSDGRQLDTISFGPSISATGHFVAFIVATDFENDPDGSVVTNTEIVVHDRKTGTTERVSADSAGNPADDMSLDPAISANGRYVAFMSRAANLVADDTNGELDIFVRDRKTGTTERVSVDSAGYQSNHESFAASISASGRYVAFQSAASNLVADDTNGEVDIFVHDRKTGATERVSLDSYGNQTEGSSFLPDISANGRYVTFHSLAANLVPDDTNDALDVFVHDRWTGTTERVSRDSAGNQGDDESGFPTISANGRYVAFHSLATNLVADDTNDAFDVFLHDRRKGTTMRVSVDSGGNQADDHSFAPRISAFWRTVVFGSGAASLVADDTNDAFDIFVHATKLCILEYCAIHTITGDTRVEAGN